jgi:hypothetical protein
MLEFLFKLELIFITTGSSGALVWKVQAHQTRQFTSNMLIFLFKSESFSTTTGSSRTLIKTVQVRYSKKFRWAYEGSAGGG